MANTPHDPQDTAAGEAAGQSSMATWKKVVAVLSLLLGGTGLALGGGSSPQQSASEGGAGGAMALDGSLQPSSFQGSGGVTTPGEGDEEKSLWAPLLAKGGLSFFIAFCIGYALRTFLKGTMLVVGVTALAVFGLQKLNIIGEIDWAQAESYWDDLTAGLGRQFESLKSFVTGSLPSAAAGGVGLVAGFRR